MAPLVRTSRASLFRKTNFVARRELANPGKISARIGDLVQATQIVGSCEVPGEQKIFRLSSILDVNSRRIGRFLLKQAGDQIRSGEIVARRKGLGAKRVFQAPVDGILKSINLHEGEITIQCPCIDHMLEAGFDGLVQSVDPNRYVDIEATVDMLRCVYGLVVPSAGIIEIITADGDALEEKHIDGGCCDRIIVSPGSINYGVLRRATAMGVKAIIAGSISARDYEAYLAFEGKRSLDYPELSILLTEGFGEFQMRDEFWEFLHDLQGRTVILDILPKGGEPVVLVPLPFNEKAQQANGELVELKKGQKVRFISGDRFGQIGTVTSSKMANESDFFGSDVDVIRVKDEQKYELLVPRWNLEVI